MMTLEMPVETTDAPTAAPAPTELVLETLRRVARRADALSGKLKSTTRESDRRVWLRAEFEIFDTLERTHPAHCRHRSLSSDYTLPRAVA